MAGLIDLTGRRDTVDGSEGPAVFSVTGAACFASGVAHTDHGAAAVLL